MTQARAAGLNAGIPPPDPVPAPDQPRTIAHLAGTTLTALGHVARHASMAQQAKSPESLKFNQEHMNRHVAEAVEHQRKLMGVLAAWNTDIDDEIAKMQLITDPASMAPIPDRPRSYGEPSDYDARQYRGPQPA